MYIYIYLVFSIHAYRNSAPQGVPKCYDIILKLSEWLIDTSSLFWCYKVGVTEVFAAKTHAKQRRKSLVWWWYARPTICPCPRNWWKRRTAFSWAFGWPEFQWMNRLEFIFTFSSIIMDMENHPIVKETIVLGEPISNFHDYGRKSIMWLELLFTLITLDHLIYSLISPWSPDRMLQLKRCWPVI